MKRRAKNVRLGLLLLLLVNSLCFVECLCDDDKEKDKDKKAAIVAAPPLTPELLPLPPSSPATSSLQQRLQRSSDSATAGRFPVFPFRTAAGVLDSTLQGKVRVIERKAPTPAAAATLTTTAKGLRESNSSAPFDLKKASSTEASITEPENLPESESPLSPTIRSLAARGRSIEFTTEDVDVASASSATASGSDVNLLPASDEPFLDGEDDSKFQVQRRSRFPARDEDDEREDADEMQTADESRSSVFSGSKFQSLKSAIKNLKVLSKGQGSGYSRYSGTSNKYRPSGSGGGSGNSGFTSSRPTATSSTGVVGPTTVAILGTGGGGGSTGGGGFEDYDDGGDFGGGGSTIPPFPSGGSSGSGNSGSGRPRPTTSPSSSSSSGGAGGQIVPILTPGAGARRSQTRARTGAGFGSSSRFDVDLDEDERQDRDYDDEAEAENQRVREEAEAPLSVSLLRATALPLSLARASTTAATATSLRSTGGAVGRAGRTRTRIVGVGFNPTTTASSRVSSASASSSAAAAAAVKPIRRLTIGGTVPSTTARKTTISSSLLSRLAGRASTGTGAAADLRSVDVDDVDGDIIRDFAFSDIRCFRTRSREYFGLTIHAQPGAQAAPYIRSRPQDPLSSSSCRLEAGSSSMHMTITDLKACGVETCADNQLCLTLVFPRLPTLAMAEDQVTTVKCTPQQQQISQITSISFQGDSLDHRRSSSTVDGGEQQFAAEVGVFRQSPGSNGLYVKRVTSGGAVKLGEPLQLRSVVRGGDGWAYSRLTDVQVWRMKSGYRHTRDSLNPSDAAEVLTLVDARGCRNPEYRLIAEAHPTRDPRNDLVYHFGFSAFLFRGQGASEPLIVTARVVACQEEDFCGVPECDQTVGKGRALDDDLGADLDDEDFLKDAPAAAAEATSSETNSTLAAEAAPALDEASAPTLARVRRTPIEVKNMSRIVHDWNTQMALRVLGPGDEVNPADAEDYQEEYSHGPFGRTPQPGCTGKLVGATLLGAFVMLVCCAVALGAVVLCRGRGGGCRLLRSGGAGREEDEEQFEFRKPAPRSRQRQTGSTRGAGAAGRVARRQQENQQQHNEGGAAPNRKKPNLPPLPPIPDSRDREGHTRGGGHSSRGRVRGKTERQEDPDVNNNQDQGSEYECIEHQQQQQQERSRGHDRQEEDDSPSRSCSSGSGDENEEDVDSIGLQREDPGESVRGRHSSRSQSRSRSRTRDKDCYIVYYCGGGGGPAGGKKAAVRSTSAPPSMRRRVVAKGRVGQSSKALALEECIAAVAKTARAEEEEEEEDDDGGEGGWGAHSRARRTVRSVKAARRSKGKGGSSGGAGGSFPSRRSLQTQAQMPVGPPPMASKPKRVRVVRQQEDGTSSDSAYSGSTSATTTTPARTKAPAAPARGHGRDLLTGTDSSPDDSVSSSLTHFVTRNEGGTQILIIPETNV